MSSTLRYKSRLPGVVVNTALPAIEAPLQLDVAGFVGFAERGPLNTPVALEDGSQYEAVFGGDLAVARDGGRPIYAALPSAVQAFFDNGGRRCYAVRVAGSAASRAHLRVPGLAELDAAGNLRPAEVEAAWVGRWGEQLGLWSQLLTRPIKQPDSALLGAIPAPPADQQQVILELPNPSPIRIGDLLRLTYRQPNNLYVYFPITTITPLEKTGRIVVVSAPKQALWPFRAQISLPDAVETVERLADTSETLPLDANSSLKQVAHGYGLQLGPDAQVQAGDLLRVTCSNGAVLLFPVARASGSRAECDAAAWIASESLPDEPPDQVKLLRFAMRVRVSETVRERFDDLLLSTDEAGWTGTLCTWGDDRQAGPPNLPASNSALLRERLVSPQHMPVRYLPLGMRELSGPDDFVGPLAEPEISDGLEQFDPGALFLDPRLRTNGLRTLMPEAERLLYLSPPTERPADIHPNDWPKGLSGIHSLIAVDEVALLAAPDFVQPGWPAETFVPLDPAPGQLPVVPPPDWSQFDDCAQPAPPGLAPAEVVQRFYGFLVPMTAGDTDPGHLESARALLTEALRARLGDGSLPFALGIDRRVLSFRVNTPPCAVVETDRTSVLGTVTLVSGVEISTDFTLVSLPEGWLIDEVVSRLAATVQSETQRRLARLPLIKPQSSYDFNGLVGVQAALITLCAARGDISAVLSLPAHVGPPEAMDWRQRLDGLVGLPNDTALRYAAAYYPWLHQRERDTPELAPLRAVPPEGAVCGTIAARELARGVWVTPAGLPLRGVVGLTPTLSDAACGELFEIPIQLNLVRQQPGRFVAISAHTLSPEPIYWQIAVRRLLIFLRKLALRRGMQYVFESNNERFRRQVQGSFERVLAQLAARGALAAYQVVADNGLNTQNDIDNGRFLLALKVAPIAPVEFITVTLLRSGEGLLDIVER